jgi:hypothetical protein
MAEERTSVASRLRLPSSRNGWIIAGLAAVALVACIGLWMQRGDSSVPQSDSTAPDVSLPSTTAPDLSDPDQRFWATISKIDALATQVPGQANAVGLAKNVCTAIQPGMSTKEAQDAATAVLSAASIRPVAVPFWAGAATAAYCPQYSELITG